MSLYLTLEVRPIPPVTTTNRNLTIPCDPPTGSTDGLSNDKTSSPVPSTLFGSSDSEEDNPSLPQEFPALSEQLFAQITPEKRQHLPTIKNAIQRAQREAFANTTLHPAVKAALDQPFGKDNINRSFKSTAELRHILLPLFFSQYIAVEDTDTWNNFAEAFPLVRVLLDLLREHEDVDFNPLKGYHQSGPETEINSDRARMATAALLFFQGDAAALIRWIGGPHTAEHRDPAKITSYLQGKIDPELLLSLNRVYVDGSPTVCNATTTPHNFREYLRYGNHSSVRDDPAKTKKALVKDTQMGYSLPLNEKMVFFTLNCHVTPQGLVNTTDPTKKPRPIFDSSFRPRPDSFAINDWTNKRHEPPLFFATSFERHLQWIYNLRISYPNQEIYLGDDDVSGAFRHLKYHPNLVAMHSCLLYGYMFFQTGLTFGDNTSPSN
jgi:hypothetical protein